MAQDIVWYELYEAISDNECPICKLLNHVTNNFIDAFLYENVNDPKLRLQLRNSNGLCNAHAWLLQSYGEPLAHAIIYGDLINDAIKEISGEFPIIAKNRFRTHHHEKAKGKCMLCELENKFSHSYLQLLDETISINKDFRRKFSEAGILCVPHLRQYAALSRDSKSLQIVKEIVTGKYEYILKCLSEICRKSDYRFSEEPWTNDECDAWTKAVRIMVGRKIKKKLSG